MKPTINIQKTLIFGILLALFFSPLQAVEKLFYLLEEFESESTIERWTESSTNNNINWDYTYGGQWTDGGIPYNPEIPIGGTQNAGLFYNLVIGNGSSKLISPYLELSLAKKPTLHFYHCQYGSPEGNDNLRLFFRKSPSSEWNLVREWTNDISYWKDEILDIKKEGVQYLTDSFQLAFEGIVATGYGVYVDSVAVTEDEIVTKYIKRSTFLKVPQRFIPSGATDIPLSKISLRVLGNDGDANLNSITVIPSGSGVDFLEPNSFKLFYTINDQFAPYIKDTSTLIATASINAGKITFTGINHELILGDNYLWISASFKNTLKGRAVVSFSMPKNGVHFNDTLFPSQPVNFGSHTIRESAFYDDFESGGLSWTREGDFEIGWPAGNQIGQVSNPSSPYNGLKILATDLDSGYQKNIVVGKEYYAYTPTLDLTYYFNIAHYMQSIFAINGSDRAEMDVSIDGGNSWKNIWASTGANSNTSWEEYLDESIDKIAKHQPQFQLRVGITHSEEYPWPGISFDNFAILGEKLYTDVGVVKIVSPTDGCVDCGDNRVQAWIRNYAVGNAPNVIPLYYGLWGKDSVLVYDTLYGGIPKDDSVLFTFDIEAKFPKGDYYNNFIVGVALNTDQDTSNNILNQAIIKQRTTTPDHFEDFEFKGGVWLSSPLSTWENKDMSGTITTDPKSPHIWVLASTGKYPNGDNSTVTSGCYDLSGDNRNVVQFKYWSDSELGKDGVRLEFSSDDGATWEILEDPVHGSQWGMPTQMVTSLGTPGWSGANDWTTVKALLPESIEDSSNVRFRIVFMSDATNSFAQGFAFDDFQIYSAPPDLGISAIKLPKDTCQFSNPEKTTVSIRNYGANIFPANEKVIIGVDYESELPIIDTFLLDSDLHAGESVDFILNTSLNITTPGTYSIKAYFLSDKDPDFYGTSNDTLTKSFEIFQNPFTSLLDTISTRQPDTLILSTYYNAGYNYIWNTGSTTNTTTVPKSDMYSVTVTDVAGNGCSTKDSTLVELLFNDVGVDSIIWPTTSCKLGTSELVKIQVRNFGTDSIQVNDVLQMHYQVNGGSVFTASHTVTESILRNKTYWYTFKNNPFNFSSYGDYQITASARIASDTVSSNDTVNSKITVHGLPVINIGPDTLVVGLSLELDATDKFEYYFWNTGDTTQTILVEEPGSYSVDVYDQNGCNNRDEINVWLRIRDIEPDMILSPESSCNRTGTEKVQISLHNNGTDTISSGENIKIGYRINEGLVRSANFALTKTLLPKHHEIYTFSAEEDLTAINTYNFEITASINGDLRLNNDTLNQPVYTDTNPVVDIDIGEDPVVTVWEYELDAGAGDRYTYEWQDGFDEQIYTAQKTGYYKVIVTDSLTGCAGMDSTFLYFDILDYAIASVSIEEPICQNSENTVQVEFENAGNLPRGNAEFLISFKVDGGKVYSETFTKKTQWPVGALISYTLKNKAVFPTEGIGEIELFLTHEDDLNTENDNISDSYTIGDGPDIDFGGDTIRPDLPHILDAGGNYDSYKWQDGSTNKTYTAGTTGTYSVTVTGNNCVVKKTVVIENPSAIAGYNADKLSVNIYPNPVKDFLNIEAELLTGEWFEIEFFNAHNGLVLRDHHSGSGVYYNQLDVSQLPGGLYLLRIRNDQILYLTKVIVR